MRTYLCQWIPALTLSLLVVATIASGASATEHMPPMISYQGHLTDISGIPLTGSYDLTFRLYDDSTGGNMLWMEEHLDVAVNNGLFEVKLGTTNALTPDSITPPSAPTESGFQLYLEVAMEGETMLPRVPMVSVPYALMTQRVDGDITTSPGGISMIEQNGLTYQKITWRTGGGEGYGEMESSDGLALTKAYDKSTPLLHESSVESSEGANLTKRIDKSSPLLYQTSIESTDGVAITKEIDKASPMLFEATTESSEGANVTKRIDKSSPLLYQTSIESTDGVAITKEIDKASPMLFEATTESSEGATITKRIDKSSPLLYQSTIESTDGVALTKAIDKASPLLYEALRESGEGATITRELDKSSPLLFSSLVTHKNADTDSVLVANLADSSGAEYSINWWGSSLFSGPISDSGYTVMTGGPLGAIMGQQMYVGTDTLRAMITSRPIEDISFNMMAGGADHREEISMLTIPMEEVSLNMVSSGSGHLEEVSLSTLPMEEISLNMSHEGGGHQEEIVLQVMPMEEVSFNMSHGGASLPMEEISFAAGPIEEVSFSMMSSGGTLPTEEIAFSTGPGTEPVGLIMYTSTSLTPGDAPTDTNVQLYATPEGAYMAMSNVGGTAGDGCELDLNDSSNSVRLRHGGANSGVYLEATTANGGRLGINTESPSVELQVEGDICLSGTVGQCSDARLKSNVKTIEGALNMVMALRGVRFNWKRDEYPQRRLNPGEQVGLVAQEVEKVLPEVVAQTEDGYAMVDYGKITPILIEAIKELQAQNAELKQRLEALESR